MTEDSISLAPLTLHLSPYHTFVSLSFSFSLLFSLSLFLTRYLCVYHCPLIVFQSLGTCKTQSHYCALISALQPVSSLSLYGISISLNYILCTYSSWSITFYLSLSEAPFHWVHVIPSFSYSHYSHYSHFLYSHIFIF